MIRSHEVAIYMTRIKSLLGNVHADEEKGE